MPAIMEEDEKAREGEESPSKNTTPTKDKAGSFKKERDSYSNGVSGPRSCDAFEEGEGSGYVKDVTPEQEHPLSSSVSDSVSSSPGGVTLTEDDVVEEAEEVKEEAKDQEEETTHPKEEQQDVQDEKGRSEGASEASKDEDISLKLNLVLPGVPHHQEVVMSTREMVHDLLQFALESPECRHRTCLSVRLNGKKIDNFVDLGSVEGLKSGSTVELVEEPYTVSDVMFHLHRFKELVGMDHSHVRQAVSCSDGHSLSFLSMITLRDAEGTSWKDDTESASVSFIPPMHCLPQEAYGLATSQPFSPPLSPLYPPNLENHFQVPDCIKSLSFSLWNPPPYYRKLKGDLVYLDVVTLEGEEFGITAQPSGFFLNKMSGTSVFDPTARKVAHHSKYLTGLLSQISPLYRKNYAQLQKLWEKRHSIEILSVPYPIYPWVAPKCDPKPVSFRIGDATSPLYLKTTSDELLVGQVGCQRDWNEEFQSTKELSTSAFVQKLLKDKTHFKIHMDFLQAAVKGAMASVDGHLHPLNASEPKKHHLYLWNNIFFSTTCDGRGNFAELGGDEAVHVATRLDLRGIGLLDDLGVQELSTLGAVIVDYRGYRVFAQSIVPGMLHRMEHENVIMYGTLDNRKTFSTNKRFEQKLKACAEKLHLKSHKVIMESDGKPEARTLPISVETKGVKGTDGRMYVLDLFRIFPPDANYADSALLQPGENIAEKSCSELGLRHKLSVLRPELVPKFISHQWWLFLALARSAIPPQVKDEQDGETKEGSTQDGNKDRTAITESTDQTSSDLDKSPMVVKVGEEEDNGKEREEKIDDDDDEEEENVPVQVVSGVRGGHIGRLPIGVLAAKPCGTGLSLNMSNITSLVDEDLLAVGKEGSNNEAKDTASLSPGNRSDGSSLEELALPEELMAEKECGPELAEVEPEPPTEKPKMSEWLKVLCGTDKPHPLMVEALDVMAQSLGSDSALKFDIKFNTDIFAPNLKRADPPEQLLRDIALATGAADYLLKTCIPRMVRDCVQLNCSPLDGDALCNLMHERGINMRYLGKVAMISATRDDLDFLTRLCISEMIVRVAKRRFRKIVAEVALYHTSAAVAHFLNCLLGEEETSEEIGAGQQKKKSKKKKAGKGLPGKSHGDISYQKLTQQQLWSDLLVEISQHYHYELKCDSLTETCTKYGIHKLSMLREFCLKTGVQVQLREYVFDAPNTFTADDVVALVPVTQHTHFRPPEVVQLYRIAMQHMSTLNLSKALEMFMEAIQLFNHVYGPMHIDIANCYKQIAKIHYSLGESQTALLYHQKATMMVERLLGVDHSETIACYFSLALYCHSSRSVITGLKLLYRVRYLISLVHGPDHPELSNCDYNIGLMLLDIKEYGLSIQFLLKAIELQSKYFGKDSIRVAVSHHLVARSLSLLGDLRQALAHEKVTFSIYKSKLGEDHQYTKESSGCLQQLTEKAVMVQKKINKMTGKGPSSNTSSAAMAALQTEPMLGSWPEVMEVLNSRSDQQARQAASRGGQHRVAIHRRRTKHL